MTTLAWLRRAKIGAILGWTALSLPPLLAAVLLGISLQNPKLNEPFFIHGVYYVLLILSLAYAGVRICTFQKPVSARLWLRDNWVGVAIAVCVTTVVLLSVAAEFRVLADETNLVGVSKNLLYQKKATFAITGKWYYSNYWNLFEVADRRPALFPFLVSLLHWVRGYDPNNAFLLNAALLGGFVFLCYRLAKSLDGELFGAAAAVLVVAAPNTVIAARSAGFDFLALFLLVAVVKSFVDYARHGSATGLALLTLHLCLFSHVRYEGIAVLGATAVAVVALGMLRRSHFRGFGWLYSLLPLFLLPRYWQMVAKANDPEQPLSISLFTPAHFAENTLDYLRIAITPWKVEGPHAALILVLAGFGCLIFLWKFCAGLFRRTLTRTALRNTAFIVMILSLETVLCFSYFWGKPHNAISARLFVWLDTFVAFLAAWALAFLGRKLQVPVMFLGRRLRSGAPIAVLGSVALLMIYLPVASEARFSNSMGLVRQTREVWKYLASLDDNKILVVTDRPGMYTIMNYGALELAAVKNDPWPLYELSRSLYQHIYVVQEVNLRNHKVLPAFDAWPNVRKETVLEFQNSAESTVRVARIKKQDVSRAPPSAQPKPVPPKPVRRSAKPAAPRPRGQPAQAHAAMPRREPSLPIARREQ